MAKGQNKKVNVQTTDDDDERGTAKNDDKNVAAKVESQEAAEANLERAMELAEEDGEAFTNDRRILRALSLATVDEKATEGISADKAAKGLPKGEEDVLSHSVVKVGKRKFLIVVTDNYRKFARAL